MPAPPPNAAPPPDSSPHVLHVDDEEGAVRIVGLMLLRLGFRVTSCNCPLDAVRRFQSMPAAFDLVLTDLLMPAMDGVEFAQQVLSIRPGIPVIVLSGFVGRWTPEELRARGICELIPKPTDLSVLSRTLRRFLPTASSSP